MDKKIIFFRNDDVYKLTDELVSVTKLFFKKGIPICHGVIPAKVTPEAASWLKKMKKRNPNLMEIDQHGFRHWRRYEFSGSRNYQQQFRDARRGKEIMVKYFGKDFSEIFTLPWQSGNEDTIKALVNLKYKAFSGNYSIGLLPSIFYGLGRLFRKTNLLGFRVSYQGKNEILGYRIKEISVSIDLIRDYQKRKIKKKNGFVKEFNRIEKSENLLGIMVHHYVFNTDSKIEDLVSILGFLRGQPETIFKRIEELI